MDSFRNRKKDVNDYFPLSYSWYINGNEANKVATFNTAADIDGEALAQIYKKDFNAFMDRLSRLDWAAKRDAKDWLYDTDYKHPGWPERFSLIRTAGSTGTEVIFKGSNAANYDKLSSKKGYKESLSDNIKNIVNKLDETYDAKRTDVPLDAPMKIKIKFFEGNNCIDDLSIEANSLRDLANKSEDVQKYVVTFEDYISSAYFGVDPDSGEHYFSAGWVVENWVDSVWRRWIGNWITDDGQKQGFIKTQAIKHPEKFKSKWITRVVEIEKHTALFKNFDVFKYIEKVGGDTTKVTFDNEEIAPTKKDLEIAETPYYKDSEIHQVKPTRADWEYAVDGLYPDEDYLDDENELWDEEDEGSIDKYSRDWTEDESDYGKYPEKISHKSRKSLKENADSLFPIRFAVYEDDWLDFDTYKEFESEEEFKEEISEEYPTTEDDVEDLILSGIPIEEAQKNLRDFYSVMIERLEESAFESVAENYEEDDLGYRWLTFVLADKNGKVFYKEYFDMAAFCDGWEASVPENIRELRKPLIPEILEAPRRHR